MPGVITPEISGKLTGRIRGLDFSLALLCLNLAATKTTTMIKLQVIGHLGKDCTTNVVNGKNVINFSVAHSERYKDATGNQKEKTTDRSAAWPRSFVRCLACRDLARPPAS